LGLKKSLITEDCKLLFEKHWRLDYFEGEARLTVFESVSMESFKDCQPRKMLSELKVPFLSNNEGKYFCLCITKTNNSHREVIDRTKEKPRRFSPSRRN
jgi:hypothetical protein